MKTKEAKEKAWKYLNAISGFWGREDIDKALDIALAQQAENIFKEIDDWIKELEASIENLDLEEGEREYAKRKFAVLVLQQIKSKFRG